MIRDFEIGDLVKSASPQPNTDCDCNGCLFDACKVYGVVSKVYDVSVRIKVEDEELTILKSFVKKALSPIEILARETVNIYSGTEADNEQENHS